MRIGSARARSHGLVAAALVAALTAARSASAEGVALDRFDPAPAGDRMFGVPSAYVAGEFTPRAMVLFDYAHDPLVLRKNSNDDAVGTVVSSQLMMHLDLGLALFHRLNLDVDLPFALFQAGTSPALNGTTLASPGSAQVGDLSVGTRLSLYGTTESPFQFALSCRAWFPTGSHGTGSYVSDGAVRWLPEVVLGGKTDRFVWSFAAGPKLARPENVATLVQGTLFKAGAGAAVLLGADRQFQIGPEVSFTTTTAKLDQAAAGVEVLLGARYRFLHDFEAGLAAGPGLGNGAGTPDARVVGLVAYSPPNKQDRDRDGIEDRVDACPDTPGIASDDPQKNGCPPPSDRDHDGILDADDACPDTPGVPDPDPKKNGCPKEAPPAVVEVVDSDGDGIPDDKDACPHEKGPANDDPKKNGCPLDTDGDGIPDDKDACPLDKGPPSDDPKKNGCPLVFVRGDEIRILEQVQFDTGKTIIKAASDPLLDEVAKVILGHSEIRLIEVQGHTDNVGRPNANQVLSDGRAKAVQKALLKRGVAAARLRAVGYGQTRPIADNATEAGRATNRRVQFIVLDRTKP